MSCFFVAEDVIHNCVSAMRRLSMGRYWSLIGSGHHEMHRRTRLGAGLWRMNRDAMIVRYPDLEYTDEDVEMLKLVRDYRYQKRKLSDMTPEVLEKNLNSLLYQCAEGEIPKTLAYRQLEATLLMHQNLQLPDGLLDKVSGI